MPEPFWEFNKNSTFLYWKGFCNKDRNERIILFNITFTQATGDMKIEVPAVPG